MSRTSLDFQRPPVIETVLGVQFTPVAGLTNGHLGWFWKKHLESQWDKAKDAPYLGEEVEVFDAPAQWTFPAFLSIGTAPPSGRLQITNQAGDRMIQVQSSRFHYNWQKMGAEYPKYKTVRAEFLDYFGRFRRFVPEAGLGDLNPIQWELTYVDYVPPGELWQTPAEWHRVLPGLLGSKPQGAGTRLERLSGEWHSEIVPRLGRVHVGIRLAPPATRPLETPGLMLQTTARGAVDPAVEDGIAAGLDVGHEAVVQLFGAITSEEAHKAWGKVL